MLLNSYPALVSSTEAKKLMKELTTMLSFDHPNVMSLIGMCLDREAPLIIMPFMLNGSVLEYVKQRKHELFLTTDNSETEVQTMLHNTYHSIFFVHGLLCCTLTLVHMYRYWRLRKCYWACVIRLLKGWSTWRTTSLFTVTWQQGTACVYV